MSIITLLLKLITLIFHLVSLRSDDDAERSSDENETSRIEVSLSEGQCVAMVFRDGYSHICYENSPFVSLSNLVQHDFVTIVLYDKVTGYFRDVLQYEHPGFNYNSNENSSSISKTATALKRDEIAVLFPHSNDIITTSSVDFQFYLQQQSIQYVHSQCAFTDTSQLITFHNITNGYYQAHFYVALIDKPIIELTTFESQFQHRMKALHTFNRHNSYTNSNSSHKSLIPKPMRKVLFSVQAYDDDDTYVVSHYNQIHDFIDTKSNSESAVTRNNDGTGNSTTDDSTGTVDIYYYSPVRIYTNSDTLSTLLASPQSSSSSSSSPPPVVDLVHVLLLSVRSIQRYEEAIVMLKSLLYHSHHRHDKSSTTASSSSSSYILVIHFVLDTQGIRYFHRLWFKQKLYLQLSHVIFVFHDFHTVCQAPVTSFLQQVNMLQSYHHSGIAGYCRLFIHDYFAKYSRYYPRGQKHSFDDDGGENDDLEQQQHKQHIHQIESSVKVFLNDGIISTTTAASLSDHTKSLLIQAVLFNVFNIITLETDQLVITDVMELWNIFKGKSSKSNETNRYNNGDTDEQWLVAAAENYQPWSHSRAKTYRSNNSDSSDLKTNTNGMNIDFYCNDGKCNHNSAITESAGAATTDKEQLCEDESISQNNDESVHDDSMKSSNQNLWDRNHGYGLIGGVMLLRLQHMAELNWSYHLVQLIQQYQQRIKYQKLQSQLMILLQQQRLQSEGTHCSVNATADNRNNNSTDYNKANVLCQCYELIVKQIGLQYNINRFNTNYTYTSDNTINMTICQEYIFSSSSPNLLSTNNSKNSNNKKSLSPSSSWEAKQNDQDIFNAVFELLPSTYHKILPCEWNIQYHARLNTFHHCLLPTLLSSMSPSSSSSSSSSTHIPSSAIMNGTSTSTTVTASSYLRTYLLQHDVTFADIPLNCPESLSTSTAAAQVFVCERQPKILHFMAGAYKGYYHFLQYYGYSWEMYAKLSWNLIH